MKMEIRPQQEYTGSHHPFELLLERESLLQGCENDFAGCWQEFLAVVQAFEAAAGLHSEPWQPQELRDIAGQLEKRPQCPGVLLAPVGEHTPQLAYDFAPEELSPARDESA